MWTVQLRRNRSQHPSGDVRNAGFHHEISLHPPELRKGDPVEHGQVARGVLHVPADEMPLRRDHGDTGGSHALHGKPSRYHIGGERRGGESRILSVPHQTDSQERRAVLGVCALREEGRYQGWCE